MLEEFNSSNSPTGAEDFALVDPPRSANDSLNPMPLFGRRRRPTRPRTPSPQGRRHQFQLLHPMATGPVGLGDIPTSKPNFVPDHLRRKRPEFIWACDDLSDLDVTVDRQFPTPAALVETARVW
jgi:hypothetical protein